MAEKLVLVVDDEIEMCGMVSILLTRNGYRVLAAQSGTEAVELFQREAPSVVVADYRMPGMSGLELLRAVKRIRRETPVILMSGNADMKTVVQIMKEDAFDFLPKPFNEQGLLAAVGGALDRAAQEDEKDVVYRGVAINHELTGQNKDVSLLEILRSVTDSNRKQFMQDFNYFTVNPILKKGIVIGLSRMEFINNVGLNFLVEMYEDLRRRQHAVVVSQIPDRVFAYFKNLGYHEYFPIEQRMSDAIRLIEREAK